MASPTPLSTEEEALLRSMGHAMKLLLRAFDADLAREHGMSQTEYDVLRHLSEAPDCTIRLSHLAGACQQSLSGLSRTVGRLESTGLVRREQAPNDARSFNAVLTDAGLARLEEAWPGHLASVRRHLFDKLDGIDLAVLATAFDRIGGDSPADGAPTAIDCGGTTGD